MAFFSQQPGSTQKGNIQEGVFGYLQGAGQRFPEDEPGKNLCAHGQHYEDDEARTYSGQNIIDVIEESMSGRIQSVLKRPEEAELVRISHLKPLFSEDVIREMVKNFILKGFPTLEDDFKVIFKIESYESIHPHNVYAELVTTIGELKKNIKIKE